MQTINMLRNEMNRMKDSKVAESSEWFFKTGPGEYGEGDQFIGIRVPVLRKLAKQYAQLSREELKSAIQSPIHEERLISLFILIGQYQKSAELKEQTSIFNFYIKHMKYVNNWDLVDSSAPYIIGAHLLEKDKSILRNWAVNKNLWKRRIAIVSTFHFIKHAFYDDTLEISEMLMGDKEDLIHKATGWMLREVGKRDFARIENFINRHHSIMPRTMLRYAIERFPETKRKRYLKKKSSSI